MIEQPDVRDTQDLPVSELERTDEPEPIVRGGRMVGFPPPVQPLDRRGAADPQRAAAAYWDEVRNRARYYDDAKERQNRPLRDFLKNLARFPAPPLDENGEPAMTMTLEHLEQSGHHRSAGIAEAEELEFPVTPPFDFGDQWERLPETGTFWLLLTPAFSLREQPLRLKFMRYAKAGSADTGRETGRRKASVLDLEDDIEALTEALTDAETRAQVAEAKVATLEASMATMRTVLELLPRGGGVQAPAPSGGGHESLLDLLAKAMQNPAVGAFAAKLLEPSADPKPG